MHFGEKMKHSEQENIRLLVDDEKTLYTKFNPEAEFDEPVKKYIRSKIAVKKGLKCIRMTVISKKPLDEEKFRSATSNWIMEEKVLLQANEENTIRLLIGLLIFGSILVLLGLAAQSQNEWIRYSILPVMGSLALSKAAGILLVDLPTLSANKGIFSAVEKNNVITFEYENNKPEP